MNQAIKCFLVAGLIITGIIALPLLARAQVDEAVFASRFREHKRIFKRKPRVKGLGSFEHKTLNVNGEEREYYIYKPVDLKNRPNPLVLAFHGGGGRARSMDLCTGGISELADQKGFIVVYPQGKGKFWNDGRLNKFANNFDVDFIVKLIDELVASGAVDSESVFSTGISNGGFFSQYLAKKIPDKIKAIAAVGATLPEKYLEMEKTAPVPILYILGTEDPLVPYQGGKVGARYSIKDRGVVVSADRAIDYWKENNGIRNVSGKEKILDDDSSDGMRIIYDEYSNGDKRLDVAVYKIIGGGHTWPGGWQYLPEWIIGKTTREMRGNEVIWEFFKRYIKPVL